MVTERQKKAVAYCERWLGIKYLGNINNPTTVSYFLSQHLADARKEHEMDELRKLERLFHQ